MREPLRMDWFKVGHAAVPVHGVQAVCGAGRTHNLTLLVPCVSQLRTLAPPVPYLLRDLGDALGTLFMLPDTDWRHARMLVANNHKNAAYDTYLRLCECSAAACTCLTSMSGGCCRHGHPTALLTPYNLRIKYEVEEGVWDVYELAKVRGCGRTSSPRDFILRLALAPGCYDCSD